MATRETKILTFRATDTRPAVGEVDLLNINMYAEHIVNAIGEGWEPVSHTLEVESGGTVYGSILVQRVTEVPDHL